LKTARADRRASLSKEFQTVGAYARNACFMHGCAIDITIIIGRKYENADFMSSRILSK